MNQSAILPIALVPEAADGLMIHGGPTEVRSNVERLLQSPQAKDDPLVAMLAGLARAPGLLAMTEAEIDAEITAYRAADRP